MNCEWHDRVSALIDGELSAAAAAETRAHIAHCPQCSDAEREFLRLRDEIKAYQRDPDPVTMKRALNTILVSGHRPLWRREVALPLPAIALITLLAFAGGALSIRYLTPAAPVPEEARPAAPRIKDAGGEPPTELLRYDGGARAAILVRKRAR